MVTSNEHHVIKMHDIAYQNIICKDMNSFSFQMLRSVEDNHKEISHNCLYTGELPFVSFYLESFFKDFLGKKQRNVTVKLANICLSKWLST